MNDRWKKDYYRMTGEKYKNGIKSFVTMRISHQIEYMKLWRKVSEKGNIVDKIRLHRKAKKYGLEIAGGAIIGANVNLHKGCTIGAENRGERKGCPIIGEKVYVGINSTIVGNIHVGNDVMIAPNTFVNFDVPDHSIVVGNPASIHKKENATQGYIAFCVEKEED